MTRHTHTYAILEVSEAAHREIADLLRAAGHEHAIDDGTIDMSGIALRMAHGRLTVAWPLWVMEDGPFARELHHAVEHSERDPSGLWVSDGAMMVRGDVVAVRTSGEASTRADERQEPFVHQLIARLRSETARPRAVDRGDLRAVSYCRTRHTTTLSEEHGESTSVTRHHHTVPLVRFGEYWYDARYVDWLQNLTPLGVWCAVDSLLVRCAPDDVLGAVMNLLPGSDDEVDHD